MNNAVLEVDRASNGTTRVVESELESLAAGHVRLRIDRFALTANNITYAGVGDLLGYWEFFPTDDEGWGRVPAIGWAEVVESRVDGIDVGGRYFGWFPMAGYVDLVATPTSDGLRDDGAHRAAHAPVYRSYTEQSRDPMLVGVDLAPELGVDHIAEIEERHALLRALMMTGFLLDEYVSSLPAGPPEQVLVLSASSKTGIALAVRAAAQGASAVVGLTSGRNLAFVRSLGCYGQVLTYDDVGSLPILSSAVVDMAGAAEVVADLHALLGDEIRSSLIVGRSHHDAPPADVVGGPAPEFFFAPTEVERLLTEWGPAEYRSRTAAALGEFVDASRDWLTIDRREGPDEAEQAWADVYAGRIAPSVGVVVSLHA